MNVLTSDHRICGGASARVWLMSLLGASAFVVVCLVAMLKTPVLGAVLGGSLIGGVLIFRWPVLGFAILTFLIPLERMQRFTDDTSTFTISIMRIVAIATLGVLMLHKILKKEKIDLDYSMFLYGGYCVFAILSLFHTTDPEGTKRALGTIAANVLFFFMYLNYFKTRGQIRAMLAIWLAANLLAAGYSAYDWHLGSGRSGGIQTEVDPGAGAQTTENRWSTVWQDRAEWESLGGESLRRSMGPTSHAAVYGINLIMALPMFIMLFNFCRTNVWRIAGVVICLALIGYNIMLTNTRAVMLQAAIAGVLCLFFGIFRVRTIHILLGIALVGIGLTIMPRDIFNRVLDPSNYKADNSAAMRVRFEYWKAGLRIIDESWLLGMGVGNEEKIPRYVKGNLSAEKSTVHNTYLQYLLEVGVFGWLLFYSFVGCMYYYAYKAARYFQHKPGWRFEYMLLLSIQVSMICVLLFGLQVDVFLFPLKGWWLLALFAIVLYRWSQSMKAEENTRDADPLRQAAPA